MAVEVGGIHAWVPPGSPRLSFSRDFVQPDAFNPSSSSSSASCDFDFGMLAHRRIDPSPADDIFRNGRMLSVAEMHRFSDPSPMPSPPQEKQRAGGICKAQSWRWFSRRSSSLSESEPLCAIPAAPAPSPSSSRFSSSRLKFLFRSSSAGAATAFRRCSAEPSLGRSASESKAGSSPADLSSNVGPSSLLDPRSNRIISGSRSMRFETEPQKQQQQQRMKARQQQQQQQAVVPRGRRDTWRAYNDRSLATPAAANARVAEVLHMDVCMGQSFVVSKVSKAFMRKDSSSSSGGGGSSSRRFESAK